MKLSHPRYNPVEAVLHGFVTNLVRPWRFVGNVRAVHRYLDDLLDSVERHLESTNHTNHTNHTRRSS